MVKSPDLSDLFDKMRALDALSKQMEASLSPVHQTMSELTRAESALKSQLSASQSALIGPFATLADRVAASRTALVGPFATFADTMSASRAALVGPLATFADAMTARHAALVGPLATLTNRMSASHAAVVGPLASIADQMQQTHELMRSWSQRLNATTGAGERLRPLFYQPEFTALSQLTPNFGFAIFEQSMPQVRLAQISEAVHGAWSYSDDVSAFLDDELGAGVSANLGLASPAARDAAAVDSGLRPQLIESPAGEYSGMLLSVGFEFRLSTPRAPIAVEAADPDSIFDAKYWLLFLEVEQTLREAVSQRLQQVAGDNWVKERVPHETRKLWAERQEVDRKSGRPVFGLVHYAHFMELLDIIVRKDNWRDAFQTIFLHVTEIEVSFRRLHPIRIAIGHNRPLGRSDALLLSSEAARILGALARNGLRGAAQDDVTALSEG